MKLPLKLTRSRSTTSPLSSTPSSPAGSTSSTSPSSSTKKKLRFPRAHLSSSGSSNGKGKRCDVAVEIPQSPAVSDGGEKGKSAVITSSPSRGWRQLGSSNSSRNGRLTESGMQEIEQVFAQFDANGDGKISSEELQAVLASLGDETTREEAAMMVREVDRDGDGFIDLHEFVEMNTRCMHAAAEEEMAAAFAIFDLDKNGRITAEELQEVLHRLGGSMAQRSSVEECRRMIRGVDRKGVGHVDFDDFKIMMTPLTF